MRRFKLLRKKDISGVSGTGPVAEGVQFTDGTVSLRWYGTRASTNNYSSIEDLIGIHDHIGTGNEGHNQIIWMDKNEENG